MNTRDSQPKLPTWIFIVFDLVALGTALFIADQSPRPLTTSAVLGVVVCVVLGAVFTFVPLIARYERQKNETLDDRQRALEALARTVHSSAEQISIATGGLHEIAELAQKNLRHAEQLPHKLQEKVAEFQAQLSTAQDTEKEELERELLALRTSESERLDAVSQRIAKSAADWTKLEAATQQHLAGANEALAKLSLATAAAIGKAQAAAEQALTQARTEAARTIGEASGNATRTIGEAGDNATRTMGEASVNATREIASARSAALADIDEKFTAAAASAVEHATREFAAQFAAAIKALDEKLAQIAATPPPPPPVAVAAQTEETPPPVAPEATPAPAEPLSEPISAPVATPPPKRPRKARRDDAPAPTPTAAETAEPAAAPVVPDSSEPTPADSSTAPAKAAEEPAPTPAAEPPPIPASRIPEVAPVAPHTAEPFTGDINNGDTPPSDSAAASAPEPVPAAVATPPDAPAPTPRKRTKKEAPAAPAADEPTEEPALALDLDDIKPASEPAPVERVLTSDGATRLLVTAYIGIGNRLFIRGTGPGLSWDKGVPLQFVSIGKWRWESNDASEPMEFKLYKNDEIECVALGAQSLDPGQQQEVTAAF
jgi:hypothetical protein